MSDKAVLVMDMPKKCDECPLKVYIGYGYMCGFNGYVIQTDSSKLKTCPLKPLPEFLSHEHVDYAHEASEINGWNKCLESLLDDDLK